MKIAIDLRSLQSGSVSGVENYTLNLLGALLAIDKQNSYSLFYNSFAPARTGELHFVNSQLKHTRYPNRLLNLALMSKITLLEKIIGPFDCLFMPNLNQFNILPSAKLAITVHDLSPVVTPEYYDFKRNLWHRLLAFKRAFARANLIFAVSEYTKLDLLRLYNVPEKKIKVVYPGIDDKVFRPNIDVADLREVRNRLGLPGDFILFLNTIEPRKNLANVIKAFEQLPHAASLVIAGRPGWKEAAIFREIKNSKKSAKIRFIGYVSEQDKPAIIKLSRMLVYPSFYEGFGFQPLEAMAIGVPAIASQLTSLPEVLGDAALLVNPYNINDIAQAMHELLVNPALRQNFITKGLERAKKYNWQKTAEQVLEQIGRLKN